MIHLQEIWDILRTKERKSDWVSLEDIYQTIERHGALDEADWEPQAPGSDIPKWKRNVRNVLQYRKKTGDVEWDGNATYRF